MKELEARLAQVETQLVEESNKAKSRKPSVEEDVGAAGMGLGAENNWDEFGMDMDMDINMNVGIDDTGLGDQMFDLGMSQFQMASENAYYPKGVLFTQPEPLFSQELLGLGIQEPLPPQELMDEL